MKRSQLIHRSIYVYMSEVGGEKRSEAETPTGNPSPAPTHPHRTHDTTDQWRDPRLSLGLFLKKSVPFWPDASNVQQASPHVSVTLMKRFLTKSWDEGYFKSRPNSFGAYIVSSIRGHGIWRCDPRYNNKVFANRWFILDRNRKVSVTDCSIQPGIIRFLWLICDFTKES